MIRVPIASQTGKPVATLPPLPHFPLPYLYTPMPPATTIRLRALSGTPLDEPVVRSTVEAAAYALAERSGLRITFMGIDNTSLTVTLDCDQLGAIGFMAQLRHDTNSWYEHKYHDGPLWGTQRLPPNPTNPDAPYDPNEDCD